MMAEPKKPKLAPPVNMPHGGKLIILVSGPVTVKTNSPNVVVKRRD